MIAAGIVLFFRPSATGPVVRGSVDGRLSTFVVDTGATKTVLARESFGAKATVDTATGTVEVRRFTDIVVTLGDRAIRDGYALPSLKKRLPYRAAGVLGNDLLLAGPVTIDGPGGRIELDPDLPSEPSLPLTFRGGLPIVVATIKVPGRNPIPVEALVDTGSGYPLLITPRLRDDLGLAGTGDPLELFIAGGNTTARRTTIERFDLGPFSAAPDTALLTSGSAGYDIIVGWPVLSKLVTTIDPAGKRIWFR